MAKNKTGNMEGMMNDAKMPSWPPTPCLAAEIFYCMTKLYKLNYKLHLKQGHVKGTPIKI